MSIGDRRHDMCGNSWCSAFIDRVVHELGEPAVDDYDVHEAREHHREDQEREAQDLEEGEGRVRLRGAQAAAVGHLHGRVDGKGQRGDRQREGGEDEGLEAADEHFADFPSVSWLTATGGLYVWMKVAGVDTGAEGPLFKRALAEGMLYVPGIHCFPQDGEPARHDMIRLSFGVQPAERIRQGMGALAVAVRETLAGQTAAAT